MEHKSAADEEQIEESQQNEGVETLKNMRLLFGSEQKIREQSEAAIKNINNETEESIENEELEEEKFQTPGLSQSENDNKNATNISNIFDRHSFQDFSMKKFQEIMFDHNITEFVDSVERIVRQNTAGNKTSRVNYEVKLPKNSITPKKESHFMSPRKFSRKEIELDSIVGRKMKHMSEKKKKRNSILDKNDTSSFKNITQDPLNKSLDYYRAKYGNYKNDSKDNSHYYNKQISNSDNNKALNNSSNAQSKQNTCRLFLILF